MKTENDSLITIFPEIQQTLEWNTKGSAMNYNTKCFHFVIVIPITKRIPVNDDKMKCKQTVDINSSNKNANDCQTNASLSLIMRRYTLVAAAVFHKHTSNQ